MADIQLRSAEEKEGRQVEGIAAVFNQATDLGWFTEEIDRNAFDECDMSDVVLNFNHDNNFVLARTTNGSLQLEITDDGLRQVSNIIDTTTGEDVLKMVRSGLINKMSFAFTIAEDDWVENPGMEKDHRIIKKIDRLFDVSLVVFPAYSSTSAFARSEDSLVEEHKRYKEKFEAQRLEMEKLVNGKD